MKEGGKKALIFPQHHAEESMVDLVQVLKIEGHWYIILGLEFFFFFFFA
jgi:hypothetical protein